MKIARIESNLTWVFSGILEYFFHFPKNQENYLPYCSKNTLESTFLSYTLIDKKYFK